MFVVAIDRLPDNGTANPSEEIVPTLAILGFFVDEMFANQINFGLFPTQKFLGNIQKLCFCCPRCLERHTCGDACAPAPADAGVERNAKIGVDNFDLNLIGFAGQLLGGNLPKGRVGPGSLLEQSCLNHH